MPAPPLEGTILVSGASSGLGVEFARQLAGEAGTLVLVARRRERLEALRDELVARHPKLRVVVEARDLSRVDEIDALLASLRSDGIAVDVLINNAGMGDIGLFDASERAKVQQMLAINVVGFTHLLHGLYPAMIARGRGGVLNVSSGFGMIPFPGFAPYVGTKHYVTGLTESMRAEATGTGVVVSQLCPGPVRTEFEEMSHNTTGRALPGWIPITAEQCVRQALRGFRRGRAIIVPGWVGWFGIVLGRLSPRWVLRLVSRPFGRLLRRGTIVAVAACTPVDLPPIAIAPEAPTTDDDLVAVPAPDADALWSWRWTRDGAAVPEVAGDRVPAELTARGEIWEVTVEGHDGSRVSDPRTARVTIGNAPPTVSVRLTPDPPAPGVALTAVVDVHDADADPVDTTFVWTVDGVPTDVDSATVPADRVHGGERWDVAVTASDGEAEVVATASAAAGNTAPIVVEAHVEPEVPTDASVLSVVWEGADADGDPVSARIVWEVDGVEVFEGDTLDTAFFEPADRVRARVEPTDGVATGLSFPTPEVVIANGAPTAAGAVVVPPVISEGVIASCELVDAVDPDGDAIAFTVKWFVDGTFVSTDPSLTSAVFRKDDQIACEATPSDGTNVGPAVLSPTVAVLNTPPTVGTVTLDPAAPTAADEVRAVVDGFSDSDGDAVQSQTHWYVDGAFVATQETWSGLVRGQVVQAVVEPFDGDDRGTPVPSVATEVGNAPPTVERAAMIPAFPTSADEVTADVVLDDADGDPTTFEIAWRVNGAVVHRGEVLPAGLAAPGDRLGYEVTPYDDTDAGTPFRTDEVVVGEPVPG